MITRQFRQTSMIIAISLCTFGSTYGAEGGEGAAADSELILHAPLTDGDRLRGAQTCRPFADINAVDSHGLHTGHYCAMHNHFVCLAQLCANSQFKQLNASDNDGRTALHHAAIHGSFDCAQILLGRNSGFIQINTVDNQGNTALHIACQGKDRSQTALENQAKIVAMLLDEQSGFTDIDTHNGDRSPALHIAAGENNLPAVKAFIAWKNSVS